MVAPAPIIGVIPDLPAAVVVPRPTKMKSKRTKFPRMNQRETSVWWWKRFLAPPQRAELLMHRDGRLAKQFWKLFHTLYKVFLDLMQLTTERWRQEWNEENRCRAGKLACVKPQPQDLRFLVRFGTRSRPHRVQYLFKFLVTRYIANSFLIGYVIWHP